MSSHGPAGSVHWPLVSDQRPTTKILFAGVRRMRRARFVGGIALACLLVGLAWQRWEVQAQQSSGVQWIWFNEGDPAKSAPEGTRYFRKSFSLTRPFVDEAELDITADDEFTVWINGVEVGKGNS